MPLAGHPLCLSLSLSPIVPQAQRGGRYTNLGCHCGGRGGWWLVVCVWPTAHPSFDRMRQEKPQTGRLSRAQAQSRFWQTALNFTNTGPAPSDGGGGCCCCCCFCLTYLGPVAVKQFKARTSDRKTKVSFPGASFHASKSRSVRPSPIGIRSVSSRFDWGGNARAGAVMLPQGRAVQGTHTQRLINLLLLLPSWATTSA
ncbi:hypothetical protein LZ32DRAFT_54257 [Colletotrichum eremochloae]|nr:hypothetical protein LZ32DRAFT_54257 [Colletotrichum eremochloae]